MTDTVYRVSSDGYIEAVKGIRRKTLLSGERMTLTEFRLEKGNLLPVHRHEHEQTGYLVSGHIVLTIGGVAYDILPGDGWMIRSNEEHFAQILEDSVAIEVFSPVREDYLP